MAPLVLTVSAELPLSAEAYLLERDGAAFRSFMAEEMELLEYEIVDCWREGEATNIRLSSKPDVRAWIPESLARKVGEDLSYQDVVHYQPDLLRQPPYTLLVNSVSPMLGDKGRFSSRTIVEPLGPDRCRHTLEQTIEFKGLFGLGAVAKKLAKKSLEDSFAEMPAIMQRWKGLREELLRTPHGRERLLAGRPRVQGVEWMEAHAASIKQARRLEAPHHKNHRHRRRSSQPAEQQGEPAGSPAIAAQRGGSAAVPSSAFAAAAGGVAEELEGAAGDSPAAALDAAERRAARQSTGLTAYFTPDAELPAQELSADLPAAPHEPVPDASQQASQQAPSSSTPGGGGRPPAGKRRVEVVRATAEGRPLAPVEEHSGRSSSEVAGSSRGLAPSYSADKSASMDGSDAEEDVQDWSTCTPWRAYWVQQGLEPLRRARTLPPQLVRKFVSGRCVQAHRIGQPAEAGRRRGVGSKLKAFAGCAGRRSSAAE